MGAFTKGKNKITNSSTITGGPGIRRAKIRKIIIVILLTIFISGAGYGTYYYVTRDERSSTSDVSVCSDDLITRAAAELQKEDLSNFSAIADEVNELDNFESDPNCVYILLENALNTGDIETAKNQFSQLKTLADDGSDQNIISNTFSPTSNEKIQVRINNIENVKSDTQSNSMYINIPKEDQ